MPSRTKQLLAARDHRPYPMPAGAWVMHQSWLDLLFAHWEVDVQQLRALVPASLELDLFENQHAYIAVVPFRMSGIRPRFVPSMPYLSAFAELNVRTYVIRDGKPGVFFFSLDAANAVGVGLGRSWFHLPYQHARMRCEHIGPNQTIDYASERLDYLYKHPGQAKFVGQYGPTGPVYLAQPGTLERWLTERYCLYALQERRGQPDRIWRGEIHHEPWPLQPAFAEIETNSMTAPLGLELNGALTPPILHFVRRIDVVVWRPELA